MTRNFLSIILFVSFLASISFGQKLEESRNMQFGAAINSNTTFGFMPINISPTGLLFVNRHQIELSLNIYPTVLKRARAYGFEFNYKFYPNSINQRFSLYFITNLCYTNYFYDPHYINNNYGKTQHQITLMGGYGFEVKFLKNAYFGLNLNVGARTIGEKTTGTQNYYDEVLFKNVSLDGAIRVSVGYRF